MKWKTLQIEINWSAEQANDVLRLVTELRDQLLMNYEDEIIAMRLAELEQDERDELQSELTFEDLDDF